MAVPIKGPVQGVATITAKNPVRKLVLDGSLFTKFVKLCGRRSLSIRFKKIKKNKKSKNRLNSIDWS